MASPVDVGGLPNHVKYCVSVLSLQWANIRTSPVEIPYNWYQSWWFKVVFDFCSKMKVVKIMFWPHHCVKEEETKPLVKIALKSDVRNGRTRHHTPAGWLATHTDARHTSHASSSPERADLTQIPDDPNHVPDPDKDDIITTSTWRHHAQLACHVSVQSADTSAW
jgi:hypothetical protein